MSDRRYDWSRRRSRGLCCRRIIRRHPSTFLSVLALAGIVALAERVSPANAFPPTPAVTGINPTSGVTGTSVTVTGTGFTGTSAVDFGAGHPATFSVTSDTSIAATAPAGTGTVDVTVTTPGGTSATSANDRFTYTTLMAGQLWMIKSNDLATIGGLGSYEWVGCGMTTAPLTPDNNYTPCKQRQDPIYTDYSVFQSDVNSQVLKPGDTVIFDDEQWRYTPVWEQQHQAFYQEQAAQLAARNGIRFINSPFAQSPSKMIRLEESAAKYASVVEVQAQAFDSNPTHYRAFILRAVRAIRAVNANVPILVGLSSDAKGVPTTADRLLKSYQRVKDSVQGFWLNANTWGSSGQGCASQGCPQVAEAFLHDIGVP